MEEAQYKVWWELHRRVSRGESLGEQERASYEAGVRRLDKEESIQGDLVRLRQARAAVAAADAECAVLRRRRRELDAEMAALEAGLSEEARQLLSVPD